MRNISIAKSKNINQNENKSSHKTMFVAKRYSE